MEEGGTYLEDFLMSLELLPNDVRRDFELMKELDKECIELNRGLTELEDACLLHCRQHLTEQINRKKRRLSDSILDSADTAEVAMTLGAVESEKNKLIVEDSSKDGGEVKGDFNEGNEAGTNSSTKKALEIRAKYMEEIQSLRERTRQKLSEKTAIVVNLSSIIERFSRKLDTDLAFFETDLKSSGLFDTPKGAEPGSEVAFTLTSTAAATTTATTVVDGSTTGSISSSSTSRSTVATAVPVGEQKDPRGSVLSSAGTVASATTSTTATAATGEIESAATGTTGTGFSANVADDGMDDESWKNVNMILGRVIFYHVDSAKYEILDVDDSRKYLLPESQVIVLDLIDSQRKLSKGEIVLALYPDTTSFYPAVVTQSSRRAAASLAGAEPSIVVQFVGDEDPVTEQIPHRTIPLKYVLRMPDQPQQPQPPPQQSESLFVAPRSASNANRRIDTSYNANGEAVKQEPAVTFPNADNPILLVDDVPIPIVANSANANANATDSTSTSTSTTARSSTAFTATGNTTTESDTPASTRPSATAAAAAEGGGGGGGHVASVLRIAADPSMPINENQDADLVPTTSTNATAVSSGGTV